MSKDFKELDYQNLKSLSHMFEERARMSADKVAYISVSSGAWKEVLWKQFYKESRQFAAGLISLGVKSGDRVCMIAENRPESYLTVMGTLMAGAVLVPVFHNEISNGLLYIADNVKAEIIIAEDQEQLDKIFEIRDKIPCFKYAVLYEKVEQKNLPWVMRFVDLRHKGQHLLDNNASVLEKRIQEQALEDTAVIMHTSGTTGAPKGVIYNHKSLIFFGRSYRKSLPLTPIDVIMIYLPLNHAGGLSAGILFQIYADISGFFAESWYDLSYNLLEVSPTFYVSMPRILEKYYSRVHTMIDDAPLLQKMLSRWSLKIGAGISKKKLAGKKIHPLLRGCNFLADLILFRKIRELFGGKIRFAASGGAPISPVIIHFFHAVGLLILEQYGSTETGIITANLENDFRFGSVGKPLPGVEIRIDEDGEILCKGEGGCQGYWNNEGQTRWLFRDEWMCTGDIGHIDEDGFLFITDRKKDLIITASGENLSPANVENLMKTNKYISECIVFGDKKPYLVALLSLDEDEITKLARDNRIIFENFEDLTTKSQVVDLISKTVQDLNKKLPGVSRLKYFKILGQELDIDEDEITPTMKVKRRIIENKYSDLLHSMYA